MFKTTASEKKDWIVNKKHIVPRNNKLRKCLYCNKILSQYNLTKHCFNHQNKKIHHDDIMEEKRINDQRKYYNLKKRNLNNERRREIKSDNKEG